MTVDTAKPERQTVPGSGTPRAPLQRRNRVSVLPVGERRSSSVAEGNRCGAVPQCEGDSCDLFLCTRLVGAVGGPFLGFARDVGDGAQTAVLSHPLLQISNRSYAERTELVVDHVHLRFVAVPEGQV